MKKKNEEFSPKVIKCPVVDANQTFSQQFLNKVDTLSKKCATRPHQIVHCMKTKNNQEFAKLNLDTVRAQIKQWHLAKAIANQEIDEKESKELEKKIQVIIKLPPDRSYAIRNGRKHHFPQRRQMVVDYQDMLSGVSLRAGDLVKALSFHSDDAYLANHKPKSCSQIQ